jgi:competence protein ComEA
MKFKAIHELFHFTKTERNGIIVLLCIIFILIGINISLPYIVKDKPVDTSAWEEEVEQYLKRGDIQEQYTAGKITALLDPNKTDIAELTKYNVPRNIASNWIKYLEKGGHFDKATDIRKIYGMNDELYNLLKGFIRIPKEDNHYQEKNKPWTRVIRSSILDRKDFSFEKSLTKADRIELNLADSASLLSLPGIGTVLAPRIIRYRNLLGGFYSIDQLREVFGLSEELFRAASPYLTVDAETFRRFDINFASTIELGRHPYIGFKTARKIVKLRDERGKFNSVNELSAIMSADSITRLSPYLKFNE